MFRGLQLGFGSRSLRCLAKCWEKLVNACVNGPTQGCCGVVQCKWCLELQVYGLDPQYGSAVWDGTKWTGSVGGFPFEAYWDNYSGECELVIVFNGVEIDRKTNCYEVGCRTPEGSSAFTLGEAAATVLWEVNKNEPLPHIEVNGCIENFCGTCECTCKALCVTVKPLHSIACKGQIFIDQYYTWSGTVTCDGTDHVISLSLERDAYTGECVLTGINRQYGNPYEIDGYGQALASTTIGSCTRIQAGWVLADGTRITVVCRDCKCVITVPSCDQPCVYVSDFPGGWIYIPSDPECAAPCSCSSPSFPPDCADQIAGCICYDPDRENPTDPGFPSCTTTVCP